MPNLEAAMTGLQQALDAPERPDTWRGMVRQHLLGIAEALQSERAHPHHGWLAPRTEHLGRERDALLQRFHLVAPAVDESADPEHVRSDLKRLLLDLQHHRQRMRDLVYDDVELELGGSD